MRRKLVAGNWKMNGYGETARGLASSLATERGDVQGADILLCPPFTSLGIVRSAIDGTRIQLGAQNLHHAASGAYTGEISPLMLKEAGCAFVLIGHSERRQYFGETDESVNLKLKAALANGLRPVVCVGETLEQREADQASSVVAGQVNGGLGSLTAAELEPLVLAYEPVWAIGTGRTATPEQAAEMHGVIRSTVAGSLGNELADGLRILYGGSVNAGNAASLLSQEEIDGALVGGASLKADAFCQIIDAAVAVEA